MKDEPSESDFTSSTTLVIRATQYDNPDRYKRLISDKKEVYFQWHILSLAMFREETSLFKM